MSVISEFFRLIAAKIDDADDAEYLLKKGLKADPTQAASEQRKAEAALPGNESTGAHLLLRGLGQEVYPLDRALSNMGVPFSIKSEFSAATHPEATISVKYQGRQVLSFKASKTDEGYYLETTQGGFGFDMMLNHPVATFEDVEKELAKGIDSSLAIPKKDAPIALRSLTNNLY